MAARDQIAKELFALIEDVPRILGTLNKDAQESWPRFTPEYQKWYTKSLAIVALLAPDRLVEFTGYYEIDPKRRLFDPSSYSIQDFVKGIGPTQDPLSRTPLWDQLNVVAIRISCQGAILAAVRDRLDSILNDLQGALAAELEDTTLDAAARLMKVNLRAAGTVAGVVIEEHLQRVATSHGIPIRKQNPTIADLNDPLREKAVYDLATWRRIQYLADIRNKCAHKKASDPTKLEVDELIAGASWVAKNVS